VDSKIIKVGELNFNVLDQGAGEPVLLLHGFPDSNKLWRFQIPALIEAGYRVIAPDLRGFGESDKPQDVDMYTPEKLVGDVLGILDALEITRTKMVAHDWGAFLGWLLCMNVPDKFERYVSLSVGHPGSFFSAGLDQKRFSWYVLLFNFPGAEEVIAANNWEFLRSFTQHHNELENWLSDLERPGALTAALNWYRANANPLARVEPGSLPKSRVPTTGIWSTRDDYLTEAQMLNSLSFMNAPWNYIRLEGASHWMQLDRPDEVNELILESLGS